MPTIPFFRPMIAGFAVTATTILVLPMAAKAQAPEAATSRCEPVAPPRHGLKLGRLLSAMQGSGALSLVGAATPALALTGAVAGAAIEAASRPRAAPACATSERTVD